jgi:protein-S-isoprenylcysteine O-methyltransferase Ste14
MDTLFIIRIVVFISGTIFFIIISNKSLKSIQNHGFFRFFVFEFTLVLILLNISFWFKDPYSVQQIISWILLIISIFLIIQSLYYLKKYSVLEKREHSPANFEFENTVSLIQKGIYKYIRHPMYGSLLFLAIGSLLKHITVITLLLSTIILISVILTARAEEKENITFFGSGYEIYMRKTKRFIPFIY